MVGTGNGHLVAYIIALCGISGSSIPNPRYLHFDDNEALLQHAVLLASSLGIVPVLLVVPSKIIKSLGPPHDPGSIWQPAANLRQHTQSLPAACRKLRAAAGKLTAEIHFRL